MDPDERAREGVFMAFQYPVEIPGVNNAYFLKAALNAKRKHHGQPELDAMEFMQLVQGEVEAARHRQVDAHARRSTKASPAARRSATRSSRWRCSSRSWRFSTRPTPASTSTRCKLVADGVNAMRRPERAIIVVTHYQRLLNYIVPDFVHVLSDGRIVKSGGKELALELEDKGYGWIDAA